MRSSSSRHSAVFLTGIVAGLALNGCAKDARERSIAVSSSIDSPAVPNTATTSADTGAAAPPSPVDTPPPATPAKPKSKPVTLPKPSIDPGRKPPSPPADSGVKAGATQNKGLSYDAATNTVTFELIAGPFTFNGYRSGAGSLVLPPKANVVMNFVNKDGTPHSAEVISGEGSVPNAAVDPAIPRAYTNKVSEGLPQEASDVMRFQVPDSGTYRIFCGVPGHGLSGMWIWMKVDPAAKAPSFGPTKG
jgi:hypothetical protein